MIRERRLLRKSDATFFDKGVLGVGDGHRILVSQRFADHASRRPCLAVP
ncbi:hypothetical protein ACWCRF_37930 [Streptomyces sp. NPDC002405]